MYDYDAPAQRAANAAADHFDARPLAFWDHHGSRAVVWNFCNLCSTQLW